MEFPLDKETMRSFLGMVNYLNWYSALSAHLTAPLSALTHQAAGDKPNKEHYDNFNRLKMAVSNVGALPYFDVRKWPNSTSAAVCIELSMIVTELGLPHIIRSDNGPCYNSKQFQQFLQCYSITHQASSPKHPRSNGFVERIVGVAKKLMDKAGKEGNHGFQVCLTTGSHSSKDPVHVCLGAKLPRYDS